MRITAKDNKWQEDLYEKAKNLAGKRYTPEINVNLPITQTFDGLARNQFFYDRARKLFGELRKSRKDIFPRTNPELLGIELINFDYCFEELLSLIGNVKEYSTSKIHWEEIKKTAKKLEEYSWNLQDKIYKVQKSPDNEKKEEHSEKIFGSESHYLSRFRSPLHNLNELSDSDAAVLSNHPFLLLMGVTGIGKTHLLCDLVNNRIESGAFSFITLGQEINATDDIWKQLLKQNNDHRIKSKTELLKKFDRLGEKTKSRFFIIIDALNESENPTFWKKSLPVLLKDIKHYPNISLIISVRNGFEKEVLTTKIRKQFHEVEHVGFRFREWEAIKEFFTEFGLPLPEIPLIDPEFSVPLFLLLFCKSRQKRAKKKGKQLFRGHEGSTSIFEDFIKGVSENVGKEFKIGSAGDVWVKLIKPLAEGMVNGRGNKDKISEGQFKKFLAKELPGVDFVLLTSSLEKNHLLIRVPHYGKKGNRTGFDYRFTYQRFSDHLISRYLMNKYADKNKFGEAGAKNNIKKALRKTGTIGRHFYDYSFKGVMNALSIQIPEWLNEELIDLAPWAQQILEEPFLESIIWRKPDAFYLNSKGRPVKTINIINRLVLPFDEGHSKFFSTVLNVAGVPDHPFNALKLHSYLMNLGMASRDNLWSSTFLHYNYGNNGSVDRLLHWVLSASFNKAISSQSKLLMGIILTWFLATSNRSIRDKSTKALVILLDNSPEELLELNNIFSGVDDPYILERLYAVTYGVVLRLNHYKDPSLPKMGKVIYESVFLAKKSVSHILIRDYAKCILDLLAKQKAYVIPDLTKVSSIQNTKWPKRLPTMKDLEDKFEPKAFSWDKASYEDRGVRAIWNSFDGIADFFRYVVEPAIGHWTAIKMYEPCPPTLKELENSFEASLNRAQRKSYKQIKEFRPFISILSYLKEEGENQTEEEKKKAAEEKRLANAIESVKRDFWRSLGVDQKKQYQKIQKHPRTRRGVSFNPEIAKRWIIKRVFELYDPKLHGYFDGMRATHYDNGRDDHPIERIGKKYQWIALHELIGYLADNFRFLEKDYPPECGNYKGAWQINIRDIDPTCIALHKPSFDNSPWQPKYDAWKAKESSEKWIKRRADLPDPLLLTAYKDPDGTEWYILNSYFKWEQDTPPEEEKYEFPSRDIFYLLYSYLVKEDTAEDFFKWFERQNFYGRWMPEVRDGSKECFFREYPDSEIYQAIYSSYDTPPDGWITKVWARMGRSKMPHGIMEVNDEFSITNASRDKSVEESFSISLPSKWLVEGMKINHANQDGFWVNNKGEIICGDLSLNEGGKSVLAVKKGKFLEFLKKNKLSLVWTLVGEKAVLGGGHGNGKIQQISGAYILNCDGTITGKFKLIAEKDRH